MFVVPTMLPAMNTTMTNASQPQNAFLRCRPLQTAMRAARLCFEDEVDMPTPDGCVRRRPLSMAPCTGRVLEPEDTPRRLLWSGASRPYTQVGGPADVLTGIQRTRLERPRGDVCATAKPNICGC